MAERVSGGSGRFNNRALTNTAIDDDDIGSILSRNRLSEAGDRRGL